MPLDATQDEFSAFWEGMDPGVVGSLSDAQKREITHAVQRKRLEGRPADIRLSLFGFFLVVIFGRERRNAARINAERTLRPAVTLRNLPMLVILWSALIYSTWGLLGAVSGLVYGN